MECKNEEVAAEYICLAWRGREARVSLEKSKHRIESLDSVRLAQEYFPLCRVFVGGNDWNERQEGVDINKATGL
jgi:hypothetical protein